jgi:hypothetical protein
MVEINCEQLPTLNQLMRLWAHELADGTSEADLLNDVFRAFTSGLLDDGGAPIFLIDRVSGRIFVPKDPRLSQYLRAFRDDILLSKQAVNVIALLSKRRAPSYCAESQPSPLPRRLTPASTAMINDAIGSNYDRAEAGGEKPANVKELSRAVQRVLEEDGYSASKRQIEKLAHAEEFKRRRLSPGKRWTDPRRK